MTNAVNNRAAALSTDERSTRKNEMRHRAALGRVAPALLAVLGLTLAACGDQRAESKPSEAPPQPAAAAETKAPPPTAAAKQAPKPDAGAALTARVKQALEADADVAGQGIDVSASGGTVRLWGTVASEAERKRAEAIAAGVAGVSLVENKLVVVRGS